MVAGKRPDSPPMEPPMVPGERPGSAALEPAMVAGKRPDSPPLEPRWPRAHSFAAGLGLAACEFHDVATAPDSVSVFETVALSP
jgi:hypothetical protein